MKPPGVAALGKLVKVHGGPYSRRWAYLVGELTGWAAIDVILGGDDWIRRNGRLVSDSPTGADGIVNNVARPSSQGGCAATQRSFGHARRRLLWHRPSGHSADRTLGCV